MEEWRAIPGFSAYEASTLGRVRRSVPGRRTFVGKILCQAKAPNGYPIVAMKSDQGRMKTMNTHRVIALTFIGPRPEGMHISHLDGDRTNPVAANLTYETPKQNHARKAEHGTQVSGENHWTRCRATERGQTKSISKGTLAGTSIPSPMQPAT